MPLFPKITFLVTLTLFTLLGCGSGENTTTNQANTLIGYFIDAEVNGLEYRTSSGKKGTTNQLGHFFYNQGDQITFYLGNLELGTATPNEDGLITPKRLNNKNSKRQQKTTTQTEAMLLRLLQSIDADNTPENGITISPRLTFILSQQEKIKLSNLSEAALIELNSELRQAIDENYDGIIDVPIDKAQQHAKQSLDKWNKGIRPEHKEYAKKTDTDIIYGKREKLAPLNKDQKFALAYLWNKQKEAIDLNDRFKDLYADEIFSDNSNHSNVYKNTLETLLKNYDLNITDLVTYSGHFSQAQLNSISVASYAINSIQQEYDHLFNLGKQSLTSALQAACIYEVKQIDDLDRFIKISNTTNSNKLLNTFNHLQSQSYNHYWDLDSRLRTMGFTQGCGSVGTEYKKLNYDNLSVQTQIHYYQVNGDNSAEVRQNMNQNDNRPNPYDAYTKWEVNWYYTTRIDENGTCKIKQANAQVNVEMLLPKLKNLTSRTDKLQQKWMNYISALQSHENGHKEIGIKVAASTLKGLEKITPQKSCDDLNKAVKQVINESIKQSKNNDENYDSETNHGMSQGAEFH